jgi:hypothetical protein
MCHIQICFVHLGVFRVASHVLSNTHNENHEMYNIFNDAWHVFTIGWLSSHSQLADWTKSNDDQWCWVYLLSSVSSLPGYHVKFFSYFSGSCMNSSQSGAFWCYHHYLHWHRQFEYVIICLRYTYSLWMSGNLFQTLHKRNLTMNAVGLRRNRAGGWSHLSFVFSSFSFCFDC